MPPRDRELWQTPPASTQPHADRSETVENLVIATELEMLSEEPPVAMLILHTMEGRAEFGINGDIAGGLIHMLSKFLRRS